LHIFPELHQVPAFLFPKEGHSFVLNAHCAFVVGAREHFLETHLGLAVVYAFMAKNIATFHIVRGGKRMQLPSSPGLILLTLAAAQETIYRMQTLLCTSLKKEIL
jgi:hypothetical protein